MGNKSVTEGADDPSEVNRVVDTSGPNLIPSELTPAQLAEMRKGLTSSAQLRRAADALEVLADQQNDFPTEVSKAGYPAALPTDTEEILLSQLGLADANARLAQAGLSPISTVEGKLEALKFVTQHVVKTAKLEPQTRLAAEQLIQQYRELLISPVSQSEIAPVRPSDVVKVKTDKTDELYGIVRLSGVVLPEGASLELPDDAQIVFPNTAESTPIRPSSVVFPGGASFDLPAREAQADLYGPDELDTSPTPLGGRLAGVEDDEPYGIVRLSGVVLPEGASLELPDDAQIVFPNTAESTPIRPSSVVFPGGASFDLPARDAQADVYGPDELDTSPTPLGGRLAGVEDDEPYGIVRLSGVVLPEGASLELPDDAQIVFPNTAESTPIRPSSVVFPGGASFDLPARDAQADVYGPDELDTSPTPLGGRLAGVEDDEPYGIVRLSGVVLPEGASLELPDDAQIVFPNTAESTPIRPSSVVFPGGASFDLPAREAQADVYGPDELDTSPTPRGGRLTLATERRSSVATAGLAETSPIPSTESQSGLSPMWRPEVGARLHERRHEREQPLESSGVRHKEKEESLQTQVIRELRSQPEQVIRSSVADIAASLYRAVHSAKEQLRGEVTLALEVARRFESREHVPPTELSEVLRSSPLPFKTAIYVVEHMRASPGLRKSLDAALPQAIQLMQRNLSKIGFDR